MSEFPPFEGFPEAGIQFLDDLAQNNNKEWFEAHKEEYKRLLQKPALSFVEALGKRLKSGISQDIIYDTRINGGGSLMRIYRDTRFSKDKTPYKDNLSIMFWEGAGKKMEHSGFGMRIHVTEGTGLIAGQFGFPKPMLQAFREAVVDDELGEELVDVINSVKRAGNYGVYGEHYKTVPRGYDKAHPRADLLKYAGLYASFEASISRDIVTSPEFVDVCYQHCINMAPIQRWLIKVEQRHL